MYRINVQTSTGAALTLVQQYADKNEAERQAEHYRRANRRPATVVPASS